MITATLTREELARAVGSDPKILRAFEQLQQTVGDTAATVANNVEATAALQDATVIVLSQNDALTSERVLAVGDGLGIDDRGPGDNLVIFLVNVPLTQGGYDAVFNLSSDTSLDLPASGRVLVDEDYAGGPYASDAAAAADGVAVGQLYRKTGGSVAWRQA